MMSHTGSAGADAAGPAERSARPTLPPATLFTFMSAMLTYFVFMLQKPGDGRNDRTKPSYFRAQITAAAVVLAGRSSHTGCYRLTQSVGIGAENAPSQRRNAFA